MKSSILLPRIAMILFSIGLILFTVMRSGNVFPVLLFGPLLIAICLVFFFRNSQFVHYLARSKWNSLSESYQHSMRFEWPPSLLFDKVIEVLSEAGFEQITSNKSKLKISAVKGETWAFTGENVYIVIEQVDEAGQSSRLKFLSISFFQSYAFDQNEKHFKTLIKQFEKSLTI